jgi:DNA polymerase (family X)
MDNAFIAAALSEIAQRLELLDEQPFRVRAFQRAAELVEGHHEPIAAVCAAGRLTQIDGIGKSIALDIAQLIATNRCDLLDTLRAQMPADLLTLLKVQGLGPKRVRLLWQSLNIDSLEALQASAERGDIAKLKGMGAKTQQTILKECARLQRFAGRTVIGQAWPIAQALAAQLRAHPLALQVSPAGSVRRGAETVGDLDFVISVAEADHAPPVMAAFVALPHVADVLSHGPSKSSVRLHGGLQVDLRVVLPHQWGSALHHFTGSYQHHIQLRARARTMGLKVNEYGVFDEQEQRVAGDDEASIYAALGLDFIPPELREGRGEVDAAEQHRLPALIEPAAICGDLHMHTVETDGSGTIAQMAAAAAALGYQYICITDHSQAVTVANGMTPPRLEAHAARIRQADADSPIRLLAGVEVDILKDGSLDMPHDLLASLDFVVGSVHSYFNLDPDAMTARLLRAIRSGLIDAVGHPTGRLIGDRDGYTFDLDAVLAAAAQHGVAMEINASPARLDLSDLMARRALDAGVKLIISTDAHSTDGLAQMHYGLRVARRAWLEPKHVLNTLPWAAFQAHLQARRAQRPASTL